MYLKIFVFSLAVFSASALPFLDWIKYFKPPYMPLKIGSCKFNTYKTDFKPDLFFTGKWHGLMSSGNFLLQAGGICGTMVSEIKGDEANVLNYQYEPMVGKYIHLRGVVNVTEIQMSNYYIKYDFISGLRSIDIPITVLGTDYNHFAVLYSCQEAFGLVAERSWIATRSPGDTRSLDQIKHIVEVAGLNFNDFEKQEAIKCPPNPPTI
ncbi:uncharacterized protein LOC106667004 [Cimex lectularius]|uniref:Uncharacterized protein n=1 Tax=Cimex lectularius TaxID=79782 RepID=A0A8I6RPF3_CIMLE|nr:uncharacterized protein LOC106667004 [Cimex lectularius]